jgi:hypothetical protein
VNLVGTVSIGTSNFHGNEARQLSVVNSSGAMAATITTLAVDGTGFSPATGAQGALISATGTANMTVNVQSSTFSNNFGTAYQSDSAGSSSMDITLDGNAFSNSAAGAVVVAAGSSAIVFDITDNNATGNSAGGISVSRSGTANSSGTVTGNIVGNPLVPGSGCSVVGCDGLLFNGAGTGTLAATVSGNEIYQSAGFGIRGNATSGSNTMNLTMTGKTISNPAAGAQNGVFVQSGAISTDTTSVCADISGNTISGTYVSTQIRVRNRFPGTLFRLPGFPGPGNSTAAVATFLSGQNGGATASATVNGNIFGGGAACPTP